MLGASVENKLLVRVDLLKNPLPLGMGSRQGIKKDRLSAIATGSTVGMNIWGLPKLYVFEKSFLAFIDDMFSLSY